MRKRSTVVTALAAGTLLALPVAASAQGGVEGDRPGGQWQERERDEGRMGQTGPESQGEQQWQQRQPQQPGQQPTGQERQGYGQRTPDVSAQGGADYVVRDGDTLAGIAREQLGSADRWREIARANDIEDPKQLAVGQRLTLPARQQGQSQQGQSPGATGSMQDRQGSMQQQREGYGAGGSMERGGEAGQQPDSGRSR